MIYDFDKTTPFCPGVVFWLLGIFIPTTAESTFERTLALYRTTHNGSPSPDDHTLPHHIPAVCMDFQSHISQPPYKSDLDEIAQKPPPHQSPPNTSLSCSVSPPVQMQTTSSQAQNVHSQIKFHPRSQYCSDQIPHRIHFFHRPFQLHEYIMIQFTSTHIPFSVRIYIFPRTILRITHIDASGCDNHGIDLCDTAAPDSYITVYVPAVTPITSSH